MSYKRFYRVALSALALLWASPALPTELIVDEPNTVAQQITKLIADAKIEDASDLISKYIVISPATQFDFAKLTAGLKIIVQPGKADLEDEISNKKFGNTVQLITEYLHFPRSENPVNQFVFLKYTFIKTAKGWQLTDFALKVSGVFPPTGWSM